MGQLGLFLLRIVFWASDQLARERDRPRDYLLVFAAHLSLAGVSLIGKVIDAFPSSRDSRHRARASNELAAPSATDEPSLVCAVPPGAAERFGQFLATFKEFPPSQCSGVRVQLEPLDGRHQAARARLEEYARLASRAFTIHCLTPSL